MSYTCIYNQFFINYIITISIVGMLICESGRLIRLFPHSGHYRYVEVGPVYIY